MSDAQRVFVHDEQHLRIIPQDPNAVVSHIRGAWYSKKPGNVIVPWTMDVARVLSSMGEPVISPLTRDYAFPRYTGKIKEPFWHQYKICDFLVRNNRAFCFADMGLGKTVSACWAADYLRSIGAVSRVLVICPLSIVNESWGDTIDTHFKHLGYSVLHGTPAKRKALAANSNFFHIINFDGVGVVADQLRKNAYDLVIIDESTAVKNVGTRRFKNINSIVNDKNRTGARARLWLLTGTPVPQGPMDAYGQAKIVDVPGLPRTEGAYRMQVMTQVAPMIWRPRQGSEAIVRNYLKPALYLNKRAVLRDHPILLPPIYRKVEMTKTQAAAFEKMRTQMQIADQGKKITAANAGVRLLKLLQLSAGSVYDDDGEVVHFDNKPRMAELESIIEQSLSKTVVYVPFLSVLSRVSHDLRKAGHKVAVIYGGVPRAEREAILSDFQNSNNIDVLVAIPNAIQHGIDAYAASTVVWFLAQSKHEVYTQASNRIDRIGQKLPMTVAHLYSHPIEKQVYEAQQNAQNYEQKLLSLYHKLLTKE